MMTIEYVLGENDYLMYYMYTASQSKALKERRNKSWILLLLALAIFTFTFYMDNNQPMAIVFAGMTVLYAFFYPKQVNQNYEKALRRQTLPMLKNNFDKVVSTSFNVGDIVSEGFAGVSKIYHSAIERIAETNDHFFIYLKTGNCIIIPKFGLEKIEEMERMLEQLGQRLAINYTKELNFMAMSELKVSVSK